LSGKAYSLSTNTDIYIYNLDTKETWNLTEGMMGYDISPVYSPNGKYISWQSMERDGYESDQIRMFIYDFDSKTKTYVKKDFEKNA
jgi:Tol biopolymer transport system component